MKKYFLIIYLFIASICVAKASDSVSKAAFLKVGADRMEILLPLIGNKNISLVVNQTSCLSDGTHLLDALLESKVNVKRIFVPEHGFRGTADAGETIVNGKDKKTGIPISSLYGNRKKPSKEQLRETDIVIFDLQDVGARFYTYISSMHYVMEACAENDKQLIILDRPNPNDHIDGPVLNLKHKSFVGMHPIPVLHGLTVGELAKMINGERWLSNNQTCDLTVVPIMGWRHGQPYSLPVKPSPNLPNDQSIRLYPSLCFFEATNVSVGRGTTFPFQVIGYPDPKFGDFTFTPKALAGFDKNPLQKDKVCYGIDLREEKTGNGLTLKYLIGFYKKTGQGASFFKSAQFMDMLSGTNELRKQIINGQDEETIRRSWQKDLEKYKSMRKKYLLYTDYN